MSIDPSNNADGAAGTGPAQELDNCVLMVYCIHYINTTSCDALCMLIYLWEYIVCFVQIILETTYIFYLLSWYIDILT